MGERRVPYRTRLLLNNHVRCPSVVFLQHRKIVAIPSGTCRIHSMMNEAKQGKKMNLYVFENVLTNYTSGMVVVAAESVEEAIRLSFKELGYGNMEEWVEDQFDHEPTAVYPLPSGHRAGVLHHVFGGA